MERVVITPSVHVHTCKAQERIVTTMHVMHVVDKLHENSLLFETDKLFNNFSPNSSMMIWCMWMADNSISLAPLFETPSVELFEKAFLASMVASIHFDAPETWRTPVWESQLELSVLKTQILWRWVHFPINCGIETGTKKPLRIWYREQALSSTLQCLIASSCHLLSTTYYMHM